MQFISPSSNKNVFRKKRIQSLLEMVNHVLGTKDRCTIADIGGTTGFWATWQDMLPMDRIQIDCINIDPEHAREERTHKNITIRKGDACDLSFIKDTEYDIAFSNSVIEHVGSWKNMESMAKHFRRIAPIYFVQTPYFWFPVEPHARTLFLHWLPEPLKYRIVMVKKCGFWNKAKTVNEAMEIVQSANILDANQFQALFPDGTPRNEKILGLTKSLILVRNINI